MSKMVSRKMKKKSGFSLVELMVVVAIIGILAVIGIPQYQKFMSKARQAEAKTHLNSIFQGESSFFTEYNAYSPNLRSIGAGAVGTGLRYNAGFTIGATCTNYAGTLPPIGVNAETMLTGVSPAATTWFYTTASLAMPNATYTACVSTTGASTYRAAAWGNPTNVVDGANNNADRFTIDQTRTVTHVDIGM